MQLPAKKLPQVTVTRNSPAIRRLTWVVFGVWFAATAFLALVGIVDPDFGFHVAWGRLLRTDFAGARHETWGQAEVATVYAYSYWIYQLSVAWLYDHVGPPAIVWTRAVTVLGMAAIGVALARRLGASWIGSSVGLVLFTTMAHERFVDRPDLVSHLFWLAALWILLLHRRDRGLWALIPLQALWANMHLYFGILPALALAVLGTDWIQARRIPSDGPAPRNLRTMAALMVLLFAAACLSPAGIGTWIGELKIAQFFGDGPVSIPMEEMASPYAPNPPSLALWAFRIGMPLSLIGALWARRRIGWPALVALGIAAALGASARRTVSIFGVTALVIVPLVVDAGLAWARERFRSDVLATILLGVSLLFGGLVLAGLANGRLFLAEDKNIRIGSFGSPHYGATPACRFLRDHDVQGPLFHNQVLAGPLLLENGSRLPPFVDGRWVSSPETIEIYHTFRQATDQNVAESWKRTREARGFQAVALDFYEMPALLRHLWSDPEWAPVFVDPRVAVFVARQGPNAALARTFEGAVRAEVGTAPSDVESRLAEATERFLASSPPPIWRRLEFPWDWFYRANFALQVRERTAAQAANLELLLLEEGSLWVSRHRTDILGNLLWCIPEDSPVWLDVCATLRVEGSLPEERRFGILLQELGARAMRPGDPMVGTLAEMVDTSAGATVEQRQWAWSVVAGAREREQDWEGFVAALHRANEVHATTPQIWRSLGLVLDLRLGRTDEAIQAYRTFLALGGNDSLVIGRLHALEQ